MPRIKASDLEEFGTALFTATGVGRAEASVVVRSLVESNLRGHDSHGIMRVPYYLAAVREGRIHPGVELEVLAESPALIACDAGWGFGQVQTRRLLDRVMPKAQALGIACGTLCRSGHIGRVGEYAEIAARSRLAMVAMANTHGSAARVAPPGGKEPRLGTNPLCIGVPTGNDDPVVLDFGTSAVAEGKVRVHKIAGTPCPPGWILDSEGRPTTDPTVLYKEPAGSILPMGGDQAYKGFGLGLVIDMLAGGLSRGLCSKPDPDPPLGNDVLFILIDPRGFGDATYFLREVSGVASFVRTCPRTKGTSEILLPGDPERKTMAERNGKGIPIDDGNWKQLVDLARELGVAHPN